MKLDWFDATVLAGIAILSAGGYMVYPPAGMIILGICLIVFGVFAAKGKS